MNASVKHTAIALAVAAMLALSAPAPLPAGYLESDYPGQTAQPTPQPEPRPEPRPLPRPIPPPRPTPAVDNPTTRLIRLVEVGQPIRWGNLVLFPLTAPSATPAAKIYSLGTAIDRGWVTISEDTPAAVGRAVLVNDSDNLVFVLAGELIKGGKQHRSAQHDLLLLPRSRVRISLYCVEEGRWAGETTKFDSARALAPQSVRAGNVAGVEQSRVWADVKAFNEAAGARSDSHSLLAGLDSAKVQGELAAARRAIEPQLPADTVGLVAGRAGRIIAADVFVDKELFAAFKHMLIDSYATQEVYHKLANPDQSSVAPGRILPAPPTQAQARHYLDRALRASYSPLQTPGGGSLWRITGPATGQSLDYRGQAVHVALTTPTPVPPPVVRPPRPPRPIPLPEPIPMPRPMPED